LEAQNNNPMKLDNANFIQQSKGNELPNIKEESNYNMINAASMIKQSNSQDNLHQNYVYLQQQQQHQQMQQQLQQNHLNNTRINTNNLINTSILSETDLILNEAKTLEEIFNQQNDPLLSNTTSLFDEHLMDSFN
jgi:hypothetical protein